MDLKHVCRLVLMLCAFLFAVPGMAESSLLNGKWHWESLKESSVKKEKEAVRIRVLSEWRQHGAYQKTLSLPEGKEYVCFPPVLPATGPGWRIFR